MHIGVWRPLLLGVALALVTASSCTNDPSTSDAATNHPTQSPRSQRATTSAGCPKQVLGSMTLRQRVGQLFVSDVAAAGPTSDQLRVIWRHQLGGAILTGRSDAGVDATRGITHRLQRHVSGAARLWVATDQEGGYVQVLSGPGFSEIPTALDQGRFRPRALKRKAHHWAAQLHSAGVNLNLAPVADIVPARLGTGNPPIGYYDREYGYRPGVVTKHARAVLRGMRAARVETTAKHFPGLGRVHANTDTTARVTDRVTTRDDPYLRPFAALADAGVAMVMVSSARYTRIDRHHLAAFSSTIMRGMLRRDLGFAGVIISDDFGTAAAVQSVPVGERAIRFLDAGGTVVLTVAADTIPPMVTAVLHRARDERRFHRLVNRAALTVLQAKRQAGLLSCR